jgi:xylulokinase
LTTLIGIDVGTSGTKAGAYDSAGRALGTAYVETSLNRSADAIEQDPAELLSSAYEAVRGCVAAAGIDRRDVAAIAISGQMAGVMGIDADWSPVTAYDSWLDTRCAPQLRRLAAEHGRLLADRTGCPPMLDHAPKMQWWRDQRPAEYERIAKFVMPAVYVAGEMAGLTAAEAFVDPSYVHFSGVADARSGGWSAELCGTLGLDAAKLPEIVPSDRVIGELTAAAAGECGLAPGVPIAAGLGDTAAGALGAGTVRVGQLLDTAGTAAVLVGCVDAFRPDPGQRLIVMRGSLPGLWMPLNYVAGAGLCIPWLLGLTGGEERGGAAQLAALLAEAAAVPPGADGLLFAPHVEGRIVPHDPQMHGGWLGLRLSHTRGHLARAILEAVAFEYATYLAAMKELHPDLAFERILGIGGGARAAAWNQIKADVLGLPYEQVAAEETATRGAALIAGSAVGLIDRLDAVAASLDTGQQADPDPARHAYYAERLPRYVELIGWISTWDSQDRPSRERQLVA